MSRYYIDTSVWLDFYESRRGFFGEPIGEYASEMFSLIIAEGSEIIISDILHEELARRLSAEQINGLLLPFNMIRVISKKGQMEEAASVSRERNLPFGDALHAVLARDTCSILVSRDKHFKKLQDISEVYKPEELV